MDKKIGIKILSNNDMAKCIKIVRKYCDHSISEIRDSITENKNVVEGNYHRTEDLLCIKKLYSELCENKYRSKIFFDDEEITIDFFNNMLHSHFIIRRQVREMREAEAEEQETIDQETDMRD